MTTYVSWQNCWEILWLIVHLELVILSSQQVGFLFTFSFKARFCSILVNNCVFICVLTLWFPDTSVQHHYNLALISVTNDFFFQGFHCCRNPRCRQFFQESKWKLLLISSKRLFCFIHLLKLPIQLLSASFTWSHFQCFLLYC